MRYLSVCSGIEAATVAWKHLGWKAVAFSEIDKFPSAVLTHHYPEVQNLGDMTKYKEWNIDGAIDILVGGTPCQSFSVAGLRKGMDDPRGNLSLVYCGILNYFQPKWFVWENVPGVLSSGRGRDFGSFLAAVAECGYGWAYRVLDAQYMRTQLFPRAVPQRRRRVFVVGCLGDWRRAAAVLFERKSLRRDSTPSRKAEEKAAATLTTGIGARGVDTDQIANGNAVASCYTTREGQRLEPSQETYIYPISARESGQGYWMKDDVSGTLRAEGENRPSRPSNIIAYPINTQMALRGENTSNSSREGVGLGNESDPAFTVQSSHGHAVATLRSQHNQACDGNGVVSFHQNAGGELRESDVAYALSINSNPSGRNTPLARTQSQVRRLTPIECERLQGFPDNYTRIPRRNKAADDCPDGPRYKAIGNSMAVNVMQWIGEQIQAVEELNV